MTTQKRKIEVFTAGCSLCDETLRLVQAAVSSCGCEVVEHRCTGNEQCEDGKRYGVRSMPSIVVDGQLVFEGLINQAQAALLAR